MDFQKAEYEFITSLNILQRMDSPINYEVECLTELIILYEHFNNSKKIQYYNELLHKVKSRLDQHVTDSFRVKNYIQDLKNDGSTIVAMDHSAMGHGDDHQKEEKPQDTHHDDKKHAH